MRTIVPWLHEYLLCVLSRDLSSWYDLDADFMPELEELNQQLGDLRCTSDDETQFVEANLTVKTWMVTKRVIIL